MKKLIRLTEGDLRRIVKESVGRILKEEKYWNPEYEFDRETFDRDNGDNERLDIMSKNNEKNDEALFSTYKWVKKTISNFPNVIKSAFQGISRIKDEKTSEGLDLYSFELFVSPEHVKSITRYANWFKERCGRSVDVFVSSNSIIFSSKKAEFESHYE